MFEVAGRSGERGTIPACRAVFLVYIRWISNDYLKEEII